VLGLSRELGDLERDGARVAFAPEVEPDLARAWLEAERAGGLALEALPGRAPGGSPGLLRAALGPVVVKRRSGTRWHAGHGRFGGAPGRAARAFELGLELATAGFPTPAPLALVERVAPGGGRVAVLFTRFVQGRGPWEAMHGRDADARNAIVGALATSVAGLHRAGVRHRDLKAPNLLVAGDPPVAWVLDLEAAARARPQPSLRVRARDLARLGASLESADARAAGLGSDGWPRLVRAYAAARQDGETEVERLVRLGERWIARKVQRNARRGRPLA